MNLIKRILLKKGGGINIKKSHEGRFTDYCGGKVTSECISRGKNSPNPKTRKQATFAANARKWKHADGGQVKINGMTDRDEFMKLQQDRKDGTQAYIEQENEKTRQQQQLVELRNQHAQQIGQTVGQIMGMGINKISDKIKNNRINSFNEALANNPDIQKDLNDGKITIKEAQEKLLTGRLGRGARRELAYQQASLNNGYTNDPNKSYQENQLARQQATQKRYDFLNQRKANNSTKTQGATADTSALNPTQTVDFSGVGVNTNDWIAQQQQISDQQLYDDQLQNPDRSIYSYLKNPHLIDTIQSIGLLLKKGGKTHRTRSILDDTGVINRRTLKLK